MPSAHVLLMSFPAQGHINPSLQFAKRLLKMGVDVTYATTVYARRRMAESMAEAPKGLTMVSFSDGYDDGFKPARDDPEQYMSEMRNRGSRNLKDIVFASEEHGRPITCLVYTLLLPWAEEVARECHIPSILLWIQPATVLGIYYYYFNGYENEINKINANDNLHDCVQLPNLPMLKSRDLPSFMLQSCPSEYKFALPTFREQIEALNAKNKPKVLVNTFDALEPNALKAIDKYELIGIGPLVPSAFLDHKDPSDTSFGGDLYQKSSKNYTEWLNKQPESSVIYVSFGSLVNLTKSEMQEMAKGLLACNRPFLWVIRENQNENENKNEHDTTLSGTCMEELEKLGMIVQWCSQLEVLTHPSLGCFVTHCGWNSTLESISCGVPLVAFPKWTDQGTNAKLIQDVWRIGVRVNPNEESNIVESEEIKRCIEMVLDGEEKAREMRMNARKWKELAREAVKEGSSTRNLKTFLQEIGDV